MPARAVPTPQLITRRAEAFLVRTVLETIMTDENTSGVLAVANDLRQYDEACEHHLTRKDVLELVEYVEHLVLAEDRIPESRGLLGKFMDEIRVRAGGAAIHYSNPLPEDSPLAGMHPQEIKLPRDIL